MSNFFLGGPEYSEWYLKNGDEVICLLVNK